ncbi:MAG: hypothetical protein ACFFA4_10895 [Promethearchaeota archaeon]
MKLDWKLFKKTYPYICDKCGYLQWNKKSICEGCGSRNSLRKISKKDWKKNYLVGTTKTEKASI